MILTQAQAKAIYDAVVALNNVTAASGTEVSFVGAKEDGDLTRITVSENAGGEISVTIGIKKSILSQSEMHMDQAAFAAAYGLE